MNPLLRHRYALPRRFEVAGRQGVATDAPRCSLAQVGTLLQ